MDLRSLKTGIAVAATSLLVACGGATDGPTDQTGTSDNEPTHFSSAKDSDGKGDQLDMPSPEECPDGAPRLVDGQPAAWTVIHWAAADNNLEEQLVGDITEMERGHEGSPNVNILVQLDRKSKDGGWRYLIEPDDDEETINSKLVAESDEELDSGNWKNLAAYGQWATVCYPAERYAVVIGGHGGGWTPPEDTEEGDGDSDEDDDRSGRSREPGEPSRLIAPDDTDGTEMTIEGLHSALRTIRGAARRPEDPQWKNRLSLYGSDACIMQTMEVLYDLRDTANFIVGSAENEPGPGWPYYTVIEDLTTRPFYYAQTPSKLGASIVENYGKSYGSRGGQGDSDDYTLSVVDTRHVDDVTRDFESLGEVMVELMDELEPHLLEARKEANSYGDSFFRDGVYIDVEALLTALRARLIDKDMIPERGAHWDGDEKWRDLREAIDNVLAESDANMIVDATFGPKLDGVSGISLYMPTESDSWRLSMNEYEGNAFGQTTHWLEILQTIVGSE